jgi:hypothetical protein
VIALLEAGRGQAARERLDTALRRFPVVEGGMLADAAHAAINTDEPGVRGWAGFTPTLEIIGEARGLEYATQLSCLAPDGTPIFSRTLMSGGAETVPFHLPLPRPIPQCAVSIEVDSFALLGSGLAFPPEFALDGIASIEGDHISGWARLGWLQRPPDSLTIEDDQCRRATIALSADRRLQRKRRRYGNLTSCSMTPRRSGYRATTSSSKCAVGIIMRAISAARLGRSSTANPSAIISGPMMRRCELERMKSWPAARISPFVFSVSIA